MFTSQVWDMTLIPWDGVMGEEAGVGEGWKLCVDSTFFYAMQVQYIYWKIKNSVQHFPQMDFAWAVYPGILTAAQVYLATHFRLLSYCFLSIRDNDTICIWLTGGQSVVAFPFLSVVIYTCFAGKEMFSGITSLLQAPWLWFDLCYLM